MTCKRYYRPIALGLVLLSFPGALVAAPVFLTPAQTDPAKLLPAPPLDESSATRFEMNELHRFESERTASQLERAKSDDKTENATIFAEVLGPKFQLKALPATSKMFADIRSDEQAAANAAKVYFKRHRPWIVDPSLKNCSRADLPESSYPSGHSTMGYSMGVVLASLIPEKAQAILARAREYAENRLVCGMHFRTDIEAGHVLGTAVAVELLGDPRFKAEYEAAKTELRNAGLTGN
jgi:acid phosphatase (class A)